MKHGKWSLSNIPFKYRLPLLIGTLLALIIVACNWTSYRAVKASAFDVAELNPTTFKPLAGQPSTGATF